MKNRSLKSQGIALGLVAVTVIMGTVLGRYVGRLDNAPEVISWMPVVAGVAALGSCVAAGMGIYFDRKAARERVAYMEVLKSFNRDEYQVGKKPPGLAEDGSFQTPFGIRTTTIVDDNGDVLVVDKTTGLLVRADSEEE